MSGRVMTDGRDWPRFWKDVETTMGAQAVLDALKAAPKVASAYDVDGNRYASDGLPVIERHYGNGSRARPDRVYWTVAGTREVCDAALRAAGWILVDAPDEGGR